MLNSRSPTVKALGGRKLSKSEALDRMMEDPNFIKRPLVLAKGKAILGYKPEEYETLR